MPNNNKKPSPFKAIPPQLLIPIIKGGLGGTTSGVANISKEFGQIRDEFKDKGYKDAKFGEKIKMLGGAAGRLFSTGNQAVLSGISQGVLGTDFGLSNVGFLKDNQQTQPQQPQQQQMAQVPNYSTNINEMGEEIPMTMEKPFKALSPYTASYSAYNMSAKQASVEPMMQKLSGAATLMTAAQENAFGPDSKLAKKDPARAKEIYDGINKND
tara:strand:- start:688 stop:1323 length:636 start_codon:yes stop_codon:yes gene_type:complete